MIRLLAFALNAHQRLEFGKGSPGSEEPGLWRKDLSGAIELCIEPGHPDERVPAKDLARIADGMMNLQCSLQDGEVWFRDD